MIERERLQELINQGATIYEVKYGKVNPVSLKNKIRFVSEKYPVIAFEPRPNEKYKHHKYFDKLYETQAEAEWVAQMHTKRTECFEPPIYKEFSTNKDSKFCFYKNGYKYVLHNALPMLESIRINKLTKNENIIIFEQPLTKRNYIKACEFAQNLFLGKENENE